MDKLIEALKEDKSELISTLASDLLSGSKGPDWENVHKLEEMLPECEVLLAYGVPGGQIRYKDKRYSYAE